MRKIIVLVATALMVLLPTLQASAAYPVTWNCAARYSTGLQAIVSGGTSSAKCGYVSYYNASSVRDTKGPICIYYSSGALYGCSSIGSWKYVGHLGGITVKTQTNRT